MKTVLSLLIVVGATLGALYFRRPEAALAGTTLAVGFLVIGAWLTGRIFDAIHLPKISGYLLFGMLAGPSAWQMMPLHLLPEAIGHFLERATPIVSTRQLGNLRFVGDLAVSLIALTAGGEIDLRWLRARAGRLGVLLSVDTLITLSVMTGVIVLASPLIPFLAAESMRTVVIVAVLGAVVMISNSPTVIIAMISDARATGPMSQMLLAFAVSKDLVLIILFATAVAVGRGVLDEETAIGGTFLLVVAGQLLGSVVVGGIIGVAMAWYVERVKAHLTIFVVGCCMLFALLGEQPLEIAGHEAHLEPLLMALSAGLLMQNVWAQSSRPLFRTIESMSLAVYALFFAVAGAKIDLQAFEVLWYVSVGLVVIRAGAVWLGMKLGTGAAGMRERWAGLLWMGLIPQAGVSLVLVALIGRSFSDFAWGADLANMLIGMIVIHELLGPIGFRYALMSSGEAGKGAKFTH